MAEAYNKKLTNEMLLEVYKPELTLKELQEAIKVKFNMDIHTSSVSRCIHRLKNAGLIEVDKDNSIHSNEMYKGRTTTFYERNAEGKVEKVHHLKVDAKKEDMLEAFKEAIENIMVDMVPAIPVDMTKSSLIRNTMTMYTIGDAHIGMMSWHRETGEDHDLEKAEGHLKGCMDMLVTQSYPTEECFIVDVGDYFHSDNVNNTTAKSGNSLDVDGRYAKVLEIGLRISTELIDKALEKHATVRWRSAIGNHNEHSAIMLNAFIKAYYRNEPRVIVHDTPSMFMYHTFGKNLIGITHGHTVKAKDLGEIMSVDCKNEWSGSEYRYWFVGHIHHDTRTEYRNCVVESFRTLAPKDAWHNASGYRSGQDMKAITIHKEYGEIGRNTVNIHMVKDKNGN